MAGESPNMKSVSYKVDCISTLFSTLLKLLEWLEWALLDGEFMSPGTVLVEGQGSVPSASSSNLLLPNLRDSAKTFSSSIPDLPHSATLLFYDS
jgi:hypothetical protein